jgi:hypothetical protein
MKMGLIPTYVIQHPRIAKTSVLYCLQVHGLEVLSSDQVGVQIQAMDQDTLNFSDSILPEAPQDLHPLQATHHLEVLQRVTISDITDFRLLEHFTGSADPVFGLGCHVQESCVAAITKKSAVSSFRSSLLL